MKLISEIKRRLKVLSARVPKNFFFIQVRGGVRTIEGAKDPGRIGDTLTKKEAKLIRKENPTFEVHLDLPDE
jgi:hypothetical protein